jgi:HAD superfamily hydrolase (TIGR01509 family)
MLRTRRHWIFDLDGTLTIAVHDFAGIRKMLGLPMGKGILDSISALPAPRARELLAKLDAHEYELACASVVAPGADVLLAGLVERGIRLGIVTQNNLRNLETTLEVTGLRRYFHADGFITREVGAPKPRPDGILRLLSAWSAAADDAVMIGNHRIDLEAGRAAGTATVYVDPSGTFEWSEHADVQVRSLRDMLALLD